MSAENFSVGGSVRRDVTRWEQVFRREAYLALRDVHKQAKHSGKVGECRACRADLLKLNA